MSQAVETNIADMARILATLFQVGPPQLWGEPFHRSGLFALVVKTLMDDKVRVSPTCASAGLLLTSLMQANTSILTEDVYVLARVAVANKQLFLTLMQATSQAHGVPEPQIWEGVLDQWWTRVRPCRSALAPFAHCADAALLCSLTTCRSRGTASSQLWVSRASYRRARKRFWTGCLPRSAICG